MVASFSHHKIQRDGQQRVVPVFLAVACHEKQQKYHDQIARIKILGQ